MSKFFKSLTFILPFVFLSLGFIIYFEANYFNRSDNIDIKETGVSFSPINPRVGQIIIFEGGFNKKKYSRVEIEANEHLISRGTKGKLTYHGTGKWYLKYKGFDQPGQKKIKVKMFNNSEKKKTTNHEFIIIINK